MDDPSGLPYRTVQARMLRTPGNSISKDVGWSIIAYRVPKLTAAQESCSLDPPLASIS